MGHSSARRRDVRPPRPAPKLNRSSAADESDSAAPVVSAAEPDRPLLKGPSPHGRSRGRSPSPAIASVAAVIVSSSGASPTLTLGSQERRPCSQLSGCADAVPPGARLQRNPLAVIAVRLAPIALEGRYRLLIGALWRLGPVLVEGILSHFRQKATSEAYAPGRRHDRGKDGHDSLFLRFCVSAFLRFCVSAFRRFGVSASRFLQIPVLGGSRQPWLRRCLF